MVAGSVVVALAPGLLTALALLPIVQFSTLPLTVGALALIVERLRARDREAPLVGIGMAVLSATILHDALVDRNLIVDPRIAQYGFAVLVVGMSVTLGNRFQRAVRERDALTRDLEARVDARTRELNEAYRRMEQLASSDALTAVLNRRAMTDRAQNELARARRHRQPFALAMVDVDMFKRVNDSSGHVAGDAVLREIARRLVATVRASDDVGRWGGEEFLVLLPGAGPEEAVGAADRLRAQIADEPITLPDGSAVDITVSVGVVSIDGEDAGTRSLDSLIEQADRALYRAKAEGRNAVRVVDAEWRMPNAETR
jgi:diguanylate cyclase (GGDEF)-like protein